MFIKEMFEKQIDRDIQGVIIVGQSEEENVAQELDEYVVTRELQKHFAEFFSAYKKIICTISSNYCAGDCFIYNILGFSTPFLPKRGQISFMQNISLLTSCLKNRCS